MQHADPRARAKQLFLGLPADQSLTARYRQVAKLIADEFPANQPTFSIVRTWASKDKWPREKPKRIGPFDTPLPSPAIDPTGFTDRLEAAGLNVLRVAESLMMAIPKWLENSKPENWTPDQGLKAMKLIPETLESCADLQRVVAEARYRDAKIVEPPHREREDPSFGVPVPAMVEATAAVRAKFERQPIEGNA